MKTKSPKLNVRLLRRIQKAILKEPSQFQMNAYFDEVSSRGNTPANCGTAACIAGWAITLSLKHCKPAQAKNKWGQWWIRSWRRASNLCGLIEERAGILFSVCDWPKGFRKRYKAAKTDRAAARVAVDRIEHLIKTGE